MQRLMLIGLNHTSAPLAVRERLAFSAEARLEAIRSLQSRFPGTEIVLLSTCNRVEFYIARPLHGQPRREQIIEFLVDSRGLSSESFAPHLYHLANRQVVEHLFCVAASLDSMIVGESQILGQVRQAYEAAAQVGGPGALLHPLFQRAVAVGKQVLGQTPLGEGRLSVASVAVQYARGIFDSFEDKTILCIGAGKMAAVALRHFADLHPKRLLVANRDLCKAAALVEQCGGTALSLEQLDSCLAEADIVISSTGSPVPVIVAERFEQVARQRQYRPIFMIDIAMPRDIEPAVGDIQGVYLYNLDDLQQVVARTRSVRGEAVAGARALVMSQIEQFVQWNQTRQLGPMIEQLYQRCHDLAATEVRRLQGKLPHLQASEREQLDDLARRIVNKVLHHPVKTLRDAHDQQLQATPYLNALAHLFDLQSPRPSSLENPPSDQGKASDEAK